MVRQQVLDTIKLILSYLPQRFQYPPVYWKFKKLIFESDKWDKDQIENWQYQQLSLIIKYAYENVPGYHELYKSNNIKPEDLQTLADIKNFPFVSKELLRDNLKDFTSRKISGLKLKYLTTGGSTGIPFGFYTTIRNYYIENAFMHSSWENAGWKMNEMSAILRGSFIGNDQLLYKYVKFDNSLFLSNYYLTSETYHRYKEIYQKFKPKFLQAYPSAVTILSKLIIENNDNGIWNFELLLLGSENLYSWQREIIKTAFPNSNIMTWYGHAEKVIFAPKCIKSDLLHLSPIYGFTEILNANNVEINIGENGELVGSSFWDLATPFIRYKTKDIALKSEQVCEFCGRHHQSLKQIEGRIHEFILSSNGRMISMTAINMHDDIFDNLQQFQFYQDTPGKVLFRFIPKPNFNQSNINVIIERLKPKLGNDFQIETKEVAELSKNKSGKFTFLEQKLKINYNNENE